MLRRQETDFGSSLCLDGASLLELAGRLAFRIGLLPGKTVAPDFQLQLFAERVHAGNADAMQSAGNLIGGGIKFSAGVQSGHHHLGGG
jgi:hypothetical protein